MPDANATPVAGNLLKMKSVLGDVVQYTLPLSDERVDMNARIGTDIRMAFEGQINCINCGRLTKKSFGGGFCFPCFRSSPEASECIIKPELCRAHEGESRDMEWSKEHCLTEQVVYLAKSSAIKVGITRNSQVPTRWIDQGASEAIVFARVPNRYTAGVVEVAMKDHLTDRTNWQRMLKNQITDADLAQKKTELIDTLDAEMRQYVDEDQKVWSINYPVEAFPTKVKSLSFDKLPVIEGTLAGIKGQYLIFDDGRVLNIRKHNGYFVTLT
ncbi:MAG: DUF2797 domain-containing protein [Pseudomonadota bacterium]